MNGGELFEHAGANIISENRIGKFDISTKFFKGENLQAIKSIMSEMIITSAQAMYLPDVIRYTAFSELFMPVEGEEVPYYNILLDYNNGKPYLWVVEKGGVDPLRMEVEI